MRVFTTIRLLLGYGSLAALVLICLWLVSLAPLRLGWGRELVGAAIATVALCVGLQLARRREMAPVMQNPPAASATASSANPEANTEPAATPAAPDAGDRDAAAPCHAAAAAGNNGITGELSQREREVLHWLAQGLSNKEIARRLTLSENTIKTHLANVYAKLGVGRRTEALKVARQLGLA